MIQQWKAIVPIKLPFPPKTGKKNAKSGRQNSDNNAAAKSSDALITAVFAPKYKSPQRLPKLKIPQGIVSLSKCALKLALAYADPWHPKARGVCIPDGQRPSTFKQPATQRITAFIGSSGLGFIALTPSLSNDAPNCYYTLSTFSSDRAVILSANNTLTTGVTRGYATSLRGFNDALIATADADVISGRVVTVNAKVTYTGTVDKMGGMVYCFEDPDHLSVAGAGPTDVGSNFSSASLAPVTRKPCELTLLPKNSREVQFTGNGVTGTTSVVYPYSNGEGDMATAYKSTTTYTDTVNGCVVGVPVALILVNGSAGETFHVDVITHVEYCGVLVDQETTVNPVDKPGAEMVLGAAQRLNILKNDAGNDGKSMWDLMYGQLVDIAKAGIKHVVPRALAAAAAFL